MIRLSSRATRWPEIDVSARHSLVRQRLKAGAQVRVVAFGHLVTAQSPIDAGDPTRPPLAHLMRRFQMSDGFSPLRGLHHFFRADLTAPHCRASRPPTSASDWCSPPPSPSASGRRPRPCRHIWPSRRIPSLRQNALVAREAPLKSRNGGRDEPRVRLEAEMMGPGHPALEHRLARQSLAFSLTVLVKGECHRQKLQLWQVATVPGRRTTTSTTRSTAAAARTCRLGRQSHKCSWSGVTNGAFCAS